MSSPAAISPSESSNKKPEESCVATKPESTPTNDEGVKNNVSVAKTETSAQPPVTNGALAESEVKVLGNGIESSTNGQEEKPLNSDGPHSREVPALLPLGPINILSTTPQSSILPSLSPNPPARQPLPQLLPMNVATAPVVATKSAPPPPTTPVGKTRGRSSAASATPDPAKEQSSPGPSLRSKKEVEEPELVEEKEVKKRKVVTKKRHSVASSDSTEKGDIDSGDGDVGRKSKRARTRTQPFQSSDMDVNLLRVIKASAAAQAAAAAQLAKANEEKLVVFFKGEFLAVRNAEEGFYICQAMHNINRGSHKIRIRWLSQATKEDSKSKKKIKPADPSEPVKDESGFDIYTPDFYDNTDFECILTNLELEKFGKDRYGLPLDERQRTENILRRAIEVEKGVVDKLELTEEHPDGLDVSLFHDESQLKRKRQDGKTDDSSSESESDSKEEVATTSGSSGKSRQSIEPEPKTSTSGMASTSFGTKRTRAAAVAAARQKIQQNFHRSRQDTDDDDTSDDDDAEDDIEEDDSSSDSESGKRRRRGRLSPKRSRPAPAPKARANVRSVRGKKLVTPPKAPIPMLMKRIGTKASYKQTPEIPSNRKKIDHVAEKPSSPLEKVVTVEVDVEMGDNETPVEKEPIKIKVDSVVVEEEKKPTEEVKLEIPKLVEIARSADDKVAEKVLTESSKETKPESKDNDAPEVKDAKSEVTDKSESVAPEKESIKEKSEKELGEGDVKAETKVEIKE